MKLLHVLIFVVMFGILMWFANFLCPADYRADYIGQFTDFKYGKG